MAKKDEQSFEEAYTELEKLVSEFEKGELNLDDSIKKFERGLELAALCKQRLSTIENKVKAIKEKFGSLVSDEAQS